MPDLDLFGHLIVLKPKHSCRGYASSPGLGPAGETCGTCMYCRRVEYHSKHYYKCRLVKRTHETGTDIRLKSPACREWKGRV